MRESGVQSRRIIVFHRRSSGRCFAFMIFQDDGFSCWRMMFGDMITGRGFPLMSSTCVHVNQPWPRSLSPGPRHVEKSGMNICPLSSYPVISTDRSPSVGLGVSWEIFPVRKASPEQKTVFLIVFLRLKPKTRCMNFEKSVKFVA